jgi:hypothetical protein
MKRTKMTRPTKKREPFLAGLSARNKRLLIELRDRMLASYRRRRAATKRRRRG